jgi:hypothetical protein
LEVGFVLCKDSLNVYFRAVNNNDTRQNQLAKLNEGGTMAASFS